MRTLFNRLIGKLSSYVREQSFAIDQMDVQLQPYLRHTHGFFVEAGANDGVSQSNTLFYEKYRHWRGLLVEPIPELAAQCQKNRPHCIVENCALVSFDYPDETIEMRYCNLMSTVKGALGSEEAENQHIDRGEQLQAVSSYELSVPAKPLNAILLQHNVSHIDFISLDVEGYELNVLQGLDLERYQPAYMLIEARFKDEIDRFLHPYYEPIKEFPRYNMLYRSTRL
ncbi:MAG: FkbM family methyltransferase [Caldilineaceae bacterium]|nr:FkbM family methyltransferase [Caldilineaceae bacterium]